MYNHHHHSLHRGSYQHPQTTLARTDTTNAVTLAASAETFAPAGSHHIMKKAHNTGSYIRNPSGGPGPDESMGKQYEY